MKFIRRLLGVLVMLAGILGLALSLAGLAAIWALKPAVARAVDTTIGTLNQTIDTSVDVMKITGTALGATVDSVDALSEMLATTADTIDDTRPMFVQVNGVMSDTLPSTLEAATGSLKTAQEAATVLESSIKSLDAFRAVLGATPFLSGFVDPNTPAYNPQVPLADSLGDLAANLETMPATFTEMAASMDKADDNLDAVQQNLLTMSKSTALISGSLGEYQKMVVQSQSSMDSLKVMLANVQSNLGNILNIGALVLTLFFLWLLATQVVILTQGWELFQGTAGRLEGGVPEPLPGAPAPAA